MQWFNEVVVYMDKKKTYSRKEIIQCLKMIRPDLSKNTYQWAINSMIQNKSLMKQGYDSYTLSSDYEKKEYIPDYSDASKKLIDIIAKSFPNVRFTVFETVLMNDFLNHLIAQNTIFIQIEKNSSIFVFRFLQEQGYQNVLYKPGKKDIDLYWSKDCIIITDMISEAPIRSSSNHEIMLEKMLVDMAADKLISSTFNKAELPDVIENARARYYLDKIRMLRYASRRNRKDEINSYLERGVTEYIIKG